MSGGADFSVLSLLQPDLLSTNELIDMLKSRCFRLENLSSMSRERTKNHEESKNPHFGCNRLKPPPDSSTFSKIRINSNRDKSSDIVINDRRKSGGNSEKEISHQKVNLKRSSKVDSSEQTTSSSAGKKPRKAIQWP